MENSGKNPSSVSPVALTERQLQDWQMMYQQLEQASAPLEQIEYCGQQIARLKAEVNSLKKASIQAQIDALPIDGAFAAFSKESLQTGLTKREYFAGVALQGLLSTYRSEPIDKVAISQTAVEFADSLIEALK